MAWIIAAVAFAATEAARTQCRRLDQFRLRRPPRIVDGMRRRSRPVELRAGAPVFPQCRNDRALGLRLVAHQRIEQFGKNLSVHPQSSSKFRSRSSVT
jgi:hypothetical protein